MAKWITGIYLLIFTVYCVDYVLPRIETTYKRVGEKVKRVEVYRGETDYIYYVRTSNNKMILLPESVFVEIPDGSEFKLIRTPFFRNHAGVKLDTQKFKGEIRIFQLLDSNFIRIVFLVFSLIGISVFIGILKLDTGKSISIFSFIISLIILYTFKSR
jgi:L-cystine uptake protein TcyP (sodium:dicarboxylate symporter family)